MTLSPTWHFISARENFAAYKSAWDSLNAKLLRGYPLGNSCFVEPLVKHFATDRDILAVRSGGDEPSGMLLLTPGRRGVVETFRPAQTEVCPVLVSSIDELQTLIHQRPVSTLALMLSCQDPDYSAFPGKTSSLVHEIDWHATTVSIDVSGDFAAYWSARSRALRKNINARLNKMKGADFDWRFDAVESPQATELAVDRYGELERRGWKGDQGTAVHSTNQQGQFYRETLRRFAEQGRGVVYELYFDDDLIASQLAIGSDSCLVTLKTAYNEAFGVYSPGKLLDYLIFEHEFELKRYPTIEFCTNAGPDLIRWGTRDRSVSNITIYRNKLSQNLSRAYRKLKRMKYNPDVVE